MIRFSCPYCGQCLTAADGATGSTKCSECGTQFVVATPVVPTHEPDEGEEEGGFGVAGFAKTLVLTGVLLVITVGSIALFVNILSGEKVTKTTSRSDPPTVVATKASDSSSVPVSYPKLAPTPLPSFQTGRQAELQTQIQELQFQKNRYVTARDELFRVRRKAIEDGITGTYNFANDAKTDEGAFLRALFGGAVTSYTVDKIDQKIAEVDQVIADYESKIADLSRVNLLPPGARLK